MAHPSSDPRTPGEPRSRFARAYRRARDPKTRFVTLFLLGAAAVLPLLLVYWIVLVSELPSTDDLQRSRFERATVVYSSDDVELTRYQDKTRRWVSLDEISPHVVEALIATEDHRFYEHHGVDVWRTMGSVLRTLAGDAQGGSTITMQFARNAFVDISDDWMLTRKIKEWITALRLEAMYEKEEILEMYLNTVPFMYNAFGIEAAAQTYFKVPARELNVKGAATLVGMLKGTAYYNPVRHPERSHERRNVVLSRMVERGYLDPAEYERVRDVPTVLDFQRLTRADELAPHFTEYLRAWLDEWAERYQYNLYTDGLRVYTTIDSRLQKAAQEAVNRVGEELQAVADVEWSGASPGYFAADPAAYLSFRANVTPFAHFWRTHGELLDRFVRQTRRFERLRAGGASAEAAVETLRADAAFMDSLRTAKSRLQAGFVAIDPRNGQVKAWAGGRDFGAIQFDHVAQSRRQPGSTFKPFVYAAALEYGYSPNDRLRDQRVEVVDPGSGRRWSPRNVGSISGSLVTLRDALAYSKNTITAQLVLDVGPERVVEMAHRMGIESELPAYPSIGLGTGEVSLLELAGAYTTLAGNGYHHEPVFVSRIEDAHGRVIARFSAQGRDAISPYTAYNVLDMMRGVVDYGTGRRIRNQYGASGDLAGKTGTTQNGADGWFMLLHPNLVAGSWVGFDVPAISFRSSYWGQGAHNALRIVGTFYRDARSSAPAVYADASFQPPPGYRPPAPPRDTTMFASESRFDYAAYLDSIYAAGDSLMDAFDYDASYDGAYEDSLWQPIERPTEDPWEQLEEETLDVDPLVTDADRAEETDAADSLQTREDAAPPSGRMEPRRTPSPARDSTRPLTPAPNPQGDAPPEEASDLPPADPLLPADPEPDSAAAPPR